MPPCSGILLAVPDNASKRARYQLGEAIGHGGQGHTFRATDTESGRTVAVKRLRLKGADSWKPFDLFERECAVLATLDHPGIPDFLDSFSDDEAGEFFLVMELVEGSTLRDMVRQGAPLEEAQLWNVLHQALEILGYLHGLNPPVIHRDVKPHNLVLRPDNRLYLVDFGGVRVALREDGGSTMVGTFGFMAPEQLHGEATPATDIYGLGATLATLATGVEADRLPRNGLKVDLDETMADTPLRALLQQMMEPDPADRPGTCAEVKAEAARLQSGEEQAPEPIPIPSAPPEQGVDQESPLLDVPAPLMFVLQVVGAMGYVGLVILDAIFLPLAFAMLGAVGDGKDKKQLKGRKQEIRKAVRSGRRTLKALARGKNPYRGDQRQLPPGPRRKQLPPRPPRPPKPPWQGRGPGRGRGRKNR